MKLFSKSPQTVQNNKPFWISVTSTDIHLSKGTILTLHGGQTLKIIKHRVWSPWREILEQIGFNTHNGQTKVINHPPELTGWNNK